MMLYTHCRRSLRGNVDRNVMDTQKTDAVECRSLRGNVDRNIDHIGLISSPERVVPYVGTWIEISM